jgi:hypothetical protein
MKKRSKCSTVDIAENFHKEKQGFIKDFLQLSTTDILKYYSRKFTLDKS